MAQKRKLSKDGSVHVTDEQFNTTSHMFGAMFSLFGLVLLVVKASIMGKPWHIVSFAIFGTSLFLLFLASSLHHGIEAKKKVENIIKLFDYFAIFPLIAGSYTPFCLIVIRGWLGWSIFGVVWGLAIFGITIKAVFPDIPKWVTNTIYVGMGWVGAVLVIPIYQKMGWEVPALIALGGVFYTVGSFIFYSEKPNPIPGKFGFHEIWHIFVILGALPHFIAMYFYLLPY